MKAEVRIAAYLQPNLKRRENVRVLDLKMCPFKKSMLHFCTIYNDERQRLTGPTIKHACVKRLFCDHDNKRRLFYQDQEPPSRRYNATHTI